MKKTKLALIMTLAIAIFSPGCKKGVETAADPIKKQAEEHYTKARRLFLTCDPDKYQDSIKEYQLALNLWDEYPEALAGLAESISMWRGFNLSEKEFGDAYQYAQRALRLNPELAAGYRAMADLSRHRNDDERALRQIEMAIRIEPNNAENLYVKGSALLTSNPKESYMAFREAQKQNPDLPKIYFNMASACQKLGNFDEAISYLEKYQQMVPSDISAYCALAMNKLSKRQNEKDDQKRQALKEEAIALMKLAIAKADPRQKGFQLQWVLMAYKTLAKIEMEGNNNSQALEQLKKAEDIYPEDLELQYLLGQTYKKLGDKKSAREHLEHAGQIAPANEDVKKALKEL